MAPSRNPVAIALLCEPDGHVREVIRNDLELNVLPGTEFVNVMDGASREKARRFLASVRAWDVAFDWELNVTVRDRIVGLFFTGGRVHDALIVVATTSRADDLSILEEVLATNNEQANALRRLLKEQSMTARTSREDETLYEELTQLNNELNATQRELARKNAELARLNEQKNWFIGMLAHDIRNPIGALLYFIEYVLEKPDSRVAEHEEFFHLVRDSSRFILGLVDDVLDLSSIEAGNLRLNREPTDLQELVARAVKTNGALARQKDIHIVLAASEPLPSIEVDARKIKQVLNNLLSNATKYSPAGSTVHVEIRRTEENARISVRDEGPGIPEKEVNKLFRPYSTTSVSDTSGAKSTGLGLAIARRIVEGHGGQIGVERTGPEGSTFFFTLPLRHP